MSSSSPPRTTVQGSEKILQQKQRRHERDDREKHSKENRFFLMFDSMKVFASFGRFGDVSGPIRTYSDVLGHIRMRWDVGLVCAEDRRSQRRNVLSQVAGLAKIREMCALKSIRVLSFVCLFEVSEGFRQRTHF